MGLFERFKAGLQKTHARLAHEIQRIVSGSPRLTDDAVESLEAALLGADLGLAPTQRILAAVKGLYESQGKAGPEVFLVARREIEKILEHTNAQLRRASAGLTVTSIVGVNGTGKTTTVAKLGHYLRGQGRKAALAACDTFRAAAIEQLHLWGERVGLPVLAGRQGADAAAVAHDAIRAALARGFDDLVVDTAGRLHTKHNLMQELQKIHRVMGKQLPEAPHEVLLVLDGSTGMNALSQAREFNKAVPLTGLVVTKLDGTSKGGAVIGIQQELGLPVKFVGLGEKAEDLQPFDGAEFARALFEE